jgi:hypothetical protein
MGPLPNAICQSSHAPRAVAPSAMSGGISANRSFPIRHAKPPDATEVPGPRAMSSRLSARGPDGSDHPPGTQGTTLSRSATGVTASCDRTAAGFERRWRFTGTGTGSGTGSGKKTPPARDPFWAPPATTVCVRYLPPASEPPSGLDAIETTEETSFTPAGAVVGQYPHPARGRRGGHRRR